MHTLDNFLDIHNGGLNQLTHSNHCEMCSFESFSWCGCLTWSCSIYIHLPLWHHRTCIATDSQRKASLTWSWWYDLTGDNFASNITWLDCYDLNDRGRMEIDHVFASGAMVRCTTMHSWGRPTGDPTRAWWHVQPQLLTQKCGEFLQPSITYPTLWMKIFQSPMIFISMEKYNQRSSGC